jgi:hypothetical protein
MIAHLTSHPHSQVQSKTTRSQLLWYQKERVQETYSPMRCTPPQTLGTHTLIVRFTSMYTYPIRSANGLPARSLIQLDPSCNRLSNTRLDTRCDSNHASQMNVLKKIPGFSLSDYVHSPRAQALPLNFNSSQPEGLIIPQNILSLS